MNDHAHDHVHDHDHGHEHEDGSRFSETELRVRALESLLVEKGLVDPAALDALPEGAREAVAGSCRYGQATGRAAGHYEETNSVGWDAAADMIEAVAQLTGSSDRTQVNDQFAGYHHRYPPPRP